MDLQSMLPNELASSWFEQAPAGLYFLSRDGTFIRCNRRALKLFRITSEDIDRGAVNIWQFCTNPTQREQLERSALEARLNEGSSEPQLLQCRIDGEHVTVEISCRTIWNETGDFLGFFECATDDIHVAQYRLLSNALSEAVYSVDGSGIIIGVNAAMARLFGYDSPQELVGRRLADFFSDPQDAEMLLEHGGRPGETWDMVRCDGAPLLASITAFSQCSPGGFTRCEGIIHDVTVIEQYRDWLANLPVGFYVTYRSLDGEDRIQRCNQEFANIFGFDSEERVIGTRVRDLHSESRGYDDFVQRVIEADKEGHPVIGDVIKTVTRDGRTPYLEIHSKMLRNHRGEIIGRVGLVRDVTKQEPLRRQLTELTHDIGNLLHSFSASLHTMATSIRPAIHSLLRDPTNRFEETAESLPDLIEREAHILARMAMDFIEQYRDREDYASLLAAGELAVLADIPEQILNIRQTVPHPDLMTPVIYEFATQIHDVLHARATHFGRTIMPICQQAWRVERLCARSSLLRGREAAVTMDYSTRALREYLVTSQRSGTTTAICNVKDLLMRAISLLSDFAHEQKITIRCKNIPSSIFVRVTEDEMVRALANLLHNSIKYSWGNCRAWIQVQGKKVRFGDRPGVRIMIENCGIGIPLDELSNGSIFLFGYRGRLASEQRRSGTGVGLTDSKQVIERYGGTLTVRSRPARAGGLQNDYTQPFITTAEVLLPISTE